MTRCKVHGTEYNKEKVGRCVRCKIEKDLKYSDDE